MARIHEHCEQLNAVWRAGLLGISAGVIEFQSDESVTDFVKRADEAMYCKKQAHQVVSDVTQPALD